MEIHYLICVGFNFFVSTFDHPHYSLFVLCKQSLNNINLGAIKMVNASLIFNEHISDKKNS